MLSSRCRFFLAVSLFCLANHYKGSSAREPAPGLNPRKWKLSSTRTAAAVASGASAKQHDTSAMKPDRNLLGIRANIQSPAAISDDVFEKAKVYAHKHSSVSGLARNDRPHSAQMGPQHGPSVVKSRRRRFRRGIFTTTLDTRQFEKDDIAGEGNRIDGEENESMRINITLTIPKLEMCVHVCLSSALCTNASFYAEKSTCTLRGNENDGIDDKSQSVRAKTAKIENDPIDINIEFSKHGETKKFKINEPMKKEVIGKCADNDCPHGTFCSATSTSDYTCLQLHHLLHRLQKRYVQTARDGKEPEAHVGKPMKEKRYPKPKGPRRLSAAKRKARVTRNINCGIPPELKNALSLFTSTTLGSTATYYCEDGIRTTNKNTIIHCLPDGKWSQPGFHCMPQTDCKHPRKLQDTVMHFYEVNRKILIIYQCKKYPDRNALTICNSSDGTWSDIELDCNDPVSAKHGILNQWVESTPADQSAPQKAPFFSSSEKHDPGGGMQTLNDMLRSNTSNSFHSNSENSLLSIGKNTKQSPRPVSMAKSVTVQEFMEKLSSKYEDGKKSDKKSKEEMTEYPERKLSNHILGQFSKSKFTENNTEIGYHGKIHANVNTNIGKPGVMCSIPVNLTFASAIYESKTIGSKAIFKCKTYFFAIPDAHCPIITCLNQGIWSELYLSCSDLDCLNPPSIYEGKRICSSSGYECRRWDEAVTDPKAIATFQFPEKNISKAHNYCRDPLNQGTPWCFTKNPIGIWDYCDVPHCP